MPFTKCAALARVAPQPLKPCRASTAVDPGQAVTEDSAACGRPRAPTVRLGALGCFQRFAEEAFRFRDLVVVPDALANQLVEQSAEAAT